MRQQLRDGLLGDVRMQTADILPDRIVEAQFAPLAQLHDGGGGERLRMRGDAEAVAGREFFAGVKIGEAEGMFGCDLAAMDDRDHDTRLLRCRQLKFEPVGDVADRGS